MSEWHMTWPLWKFPVTGKGKAVLKEPIIPLCANDDCEIEIEGIDLLSCVGIVTLLCYGHNYVILAYQKIFRSYASLICLPTSSPGQMKYTLLLLLQVLSSYLLWYTTSPR